MVRWLSIQIICCFVLPVLCMAGNAERINAAPLSSRIDGLSLTAKLNQRLGNQELKPLTIETSRLKPLPKHVKDQRVAQANKEFVRRKKVKLILSHAR